MEKEIKDLVEQISKSTNEIAKDFEMKYRDFVPDFLVLADCHDKIQQSINEGNQQLKKIEAQIVDTEKALVNAKEDYPNAKKEVMKDFLERLSILSEIERCLNSLWLLPVNNFAFDPLSNVRVVLRLGELSKMLDLESPNNLEAVNERILPLLFSEINSRKSELRQQLGEFYQGFLQFKDNDRVSPPNTVMSIFCPSTKAAVDNFSAMHQLGMFEEELDLFVDSVWEQFCMKLIYSDEAPEEIMKITTDNYVEHKMNFEIKKEVRLTKKPVPSAVFRGLTKFFDGLYNAFRATRVDDRFLSDFFGECISSRLISALEKGCLNPAIPFEKERAAAVHVELTSLTTDFLHFMKEKSFFVQPVNDLFENFFNSFDRITIDRRCHHYITTARELIKKPYIELVDVGSMEGNDEEKAVEIMKKMDERYKIKPEIVDPSSSTRWDKYNTKIYQFQRCKISKSTFELVNLIQEILRESVGSSSEMETCRLMTTARNVLEMLVNTAPNYHMKALTSVPQIAAVFFNNCHYICHRLMTLSADMMQTMLKISKVSQQNISFTELFSELRSLAAKTLEIHVVNARQMLSTTIGENDIFINLRDDNAHKNCQKTLYACVLQIQQTANVWTGVMPKFVFSQSIGALVSHLFILLADLILKREDIASSDAEIMAVLLESLIEQCKEIMTLDGKSLIQKICGGPFYMLSEIIFCLKGSLAEIGHRWCEGNGPLSTWLTALQVKQLIRALFQNTERRAKLISQIN